jgi:geranylgeranyl diphosphate synthase type I
MTKTNDLVTLFKPYVKQVNEGLVSLLDKKEPDRLYKFVGYQLGLFDEGFEQVKTPKAGKRLRSAIPLLCAKHTDCGEQALNAAMSLELFHNFTLIIDDIQDGDAVRRGRPTLWKLVDIPQALNAALIMQSLSIETMRDATTHLKNSEATKWLEDWNRLLQRVFEGQYWDLSFERQDQVFTANYILMAQNKTATLLGQSFAQSFHIHPKEEFRKLGSAMRDIGASAGLAFQIQDDILGLWGDPKKTGKPVGSDLRRHKKTFPIIHALENGSRSTKKFILDAYSKKIEDSEVERLLSCLETAGSKEYAEQQVRAYTSNALLQLDRVQIDGELKEKLVLIIESMAKRDA